MCAKAIPNPSSMSSIVSDTQVLNNILLTHILHELMNNFVHEFFAQRKAIVNVIKRQNYINGTILRKVLRPNLINCSL